MSSLTMSSTVTPGVSRAGVEARSLARRALRSSRNDQASLADGGELVRRVALEIVGQLRGR